MQTAITREYHFESGHFLPKVPVGHKCAKQHGHNYKMLVTVMGFPDQTGFVIDFWDLDKIVDPIVKQVDHHNLNDIPGLENPTAELIAAWFIRQLTMFNRIKICIYETDTCCAEVSNGI